MTTLASARFVADPGQRIIDGARAPALPTVKIDKGVRMPPPSTRGAKPGQRFKARLPWRALKITDSFAFPPSASGDFAETRNRASSDINAQHKRNPERFELRVVEEDGQRVVRIWRVA